MFAVVARAALGGGPNLVGTTLMMVLSYMMEHKYTLGARLMLVLDNTSGENKCNAVVGALLQRTHSELHNAHSCAHMLIIARGCA